MQIDQRKIIGYQIQANPSPIEFKYNCNGYGLTFHNKLWTKQKVRNEWKVPNDGLTFRGQFVSSFIYRSMFMFQGLTMAMAWRFAKSYERSTM